MGGEKVRTRAKTISTEDRVTLTVRIPLEEKVALVEEAKKRDITVTELIRRSLRETIGIGKKKIEWPKPRALGIGKLRRKDLYEK